jgi:hypothetical protein
MGWLACAGQRETAEATREGQQLASGLRAAALAAAAAHADAMSEAVEAGAAASLRAVNSEAAGVQAGAARAAAEGALKQQGSTLAGTLDRFTALQSASERRETLAAELAAAAAQAHLAQLAQRDHLEKEAAGELARALAALGVLTDTTAMLQAGLLQAGLCAASKAESAAKRYGALHSASAKAEAAAAAVRAERLALVARVAELEGAVEGGLARVEAGLAREAVLERRAGLAAEQAVGLRESLGGTTPRCRSLCLCPCPHAAVH